MQINALQLPHVLSECCAAAGCPPNIMGHEVHLDLQGTPAGMVYRCEGMGDMLYVYFDLGYPEDRKMSRKLLELNASITPPANGYYAIDPVLESVIYRVNVPLASVSDGATLHRALCTLAKNAARAMND